LQIGDPNHQTIYADDPVTIARQWIAAGATWLHVVNLDGAFDEAGAINWQALPSLTCLGANVQFGGGVRVLADIERAWTAGVRRVVLGTAAVENPSLVAEGVGRFGPERIVVGIDVRHGRVKTHGWQANTAVTAIELGQQMKALGVQTVIYTDIGRDGILTGVDAAGAAEVAQATGLRVIASGGVASLDDVHRTRALAGQGIAGLIIGRALYEGKIGLKEALLAS
jgi:phosphoribosylformimino-5-aminoimidazole carboxamide ribotide isomerase